MDKLLYIIVTLLVFVLLALFYGSDSQEARTPQKIQTCWVCTNSTIKEMMAHHGVIIARREFAGIGLGKLCFERDGENCTADISEFRRSQDGD
jgi:hypothetical protein